MAVLAFIVFVTPLFATGLSSTTTFLHFRSPDRVLSSSMSSPTQQMKQSSHASVNASSHRPPTVFASPSKIERPSSAASRISIDNKPPPLRTAIPTLKSWEVLIALNCATVKLNGQHVIVNYRGPQYYMQNTQEQQLITSLQPHQPTVVRNVQSSAAGIDDSDFSRFGRDGKKLQCVGRFEGRCSRFDVSGEAFSVIIIGFTFSDTGIYRCLNDDGQTLADYDVSMKENIIPSAVLNQPMLFIDVRPYATKQPLLEQNTLGIFLATVCGGLFFVITVVVSVCFFSEDPSPGKFPNSAALLKMSGGLHHRASSVQSRKSSTVVFASTSQNLGASQPKNSARPVVVVHSGEPSLGGDSKSPSLKKPRVVINRISADNSAGVSDNGEKSNLLVVPSRSGCGGMVAASTSANALFCDNLHPQQPEMDTQSISQELRLFRLAVHLTKQQQLEIARAAYDDAQMVPDGCQQPQDDDNNPDDEHETSFVSNRTNSSAVGTPRLFISDNILVLPKTRKV